MRIHSKHNISKSFFFGIGRLFYDNTYNAIYDQNNVSVMCLQVHYYCMWVCVWMGEESVCVCVCGWERRVYGSVCIAVCAGS